MIGQNISHYRILEKLGGGGMGVVYKAQDTKLKRTVALKFLPPELTRNEEAKTRFVHEAQAASALQHPNICTIHDIDETADHQLFIVMDCYEGETLKQIIERGPLPIEKAVDITAQVAQGLAKAHDHNIIHRDIKPANIMITGDGAAKIVDFGLAKLAGRTLLTRTGSTVGTAAYMSPEQARSEAVDARSDIWSLGVVLYEMLTGRKPFESDYEQALVYSIINEDPKEMRQLRPDLPEALEKICRRAMAKETKDRYQTAAELIADLESYKAGTDLSRSTKRIVGGRRKLLYRTIAATLILVLIWVAMMFIFRNRGPRLNPNRTLVKIRVPAKFSEIWNCCLSADGNWLAISARDEKDAWDIYLMNIVGGEPRRVTNEAAGMIYGSGLSRDMSQIAYSSIGVKDSCYRVKVVSSQGGPSRTIVDAGFLPIWRPDGQRIGYIRCGGERWFFTGKFEVWSIRPDGTDNRLEFVDTLHALTWPLAFCWSPDGGSIAWVRNWPEGYSEIMVRELSTGKERQLTFDKKNADEPNWVSNGMILFVSNRSGQSNTWMIPAGGGEAVQLTQGTVPIMGAGLSADCKTLVYSQHEYFGHVWTSALDGSNLRRVTSGDVYIFGCSFSPDGRHLVCRFADVDQYKPERYLVVMDRDGTNQRQLTSGSAIAAMKTVWSPDGKWLVYSSRLVGEPPDSIKVYLIQPLNPSSPLLLCSRALYAWVDNESLVTYRSWKTLLRNVKGDSLGQVFRDSTFAIPIQGGKKMLFQDFRQGRQGWWIVSVDAAGREKGQAKRLLGSIVDPVIAPDYRFLVYGKRGPEGPELWRVWTSTGKVERLGRQITGFQSLWGISGDGKELYWTRETFRASLGLVKDVFE